MTRGGTKTGGDFFNGWSWLGSKMNHGICEARPTSGQRLIVLARGGTSIGIRQVAELAKAWSVSKEIAARRATIAALERVDGTDRRHVLRDLTKKSDVGIAENALRPQRGYSLDSTNHRRGDGLGHPTGQGASRYRSVDNSYNPYKPGYSLPPRPLEPSRHSAASSSIEQKNLTREQCRQASDTIAKAVHARILLTRMNDEQ